MRTHEFNDGAIDFNDEIVGIEAVGEKETIDITVTGDHLFYCNDILTKNSIGLPNILDLYLAVMRTEEMDDIGQIKYKQLKNRDNDEANMRDFIMGIDMARMKLWDLKDSNLNGPPSGNPLANTQTIKKGVSSFNFD